MRGYSADLHKYVVSMVLLQQSVTGFCVQQLSFQSGVKEWRTTEVT